MMKSKTVFAAVAAFGLLAGVSFASNPVVAKLAAPTSESRVIAAGAVWACEGDTCQARLNKKVTARVCMELAREVGQVTAFGDLSAEDVARCNTRAAVTATTTVAAR